MCGCVHVGIVCLCVCECVSLNSVVVCRSMCENIQ